MDQQIDEERKEGQDARNSGVGTPRRRSKPSGIDEEKASWGAFEPLQPSPLTLMRNQICGTWGATPMVLRPTHEGRE